MEKTKLAVSAFAMTPDSSNIAQIAKIDGGILVQFKNGSMYSYAGADDEVFESFTKAESVGKFMNAQIKGKFEFKKLEDTELVKDGAEDVSKKVEQT